MKFQIGNFHYTSHQVILHGNIKLEDLEEVRIFFICILFLVTYPFQAIRGGGPNRTPTLNPYTVANGFFGGYYD